MKLIKSIFVLGAAASLSACMDVPKQDKTVDNWVDDGDLSNLVSGIWIDPNGCQHWIIDDGVEGYMDPRLDRYGKPICNDLYPVNTAIGDFQKGEGIADII